MVVVAVLCVVFVFRVRLHTGYRYDQVSDIYQSLTL